MGVLRPDVSISFDKLDAPPHEIEFLWKVSIRTILAGGSESHKGNTS